MPTAARWAVFRHGLLDRQRIACGRFYPQRAKTAECAYYATHFPMVEVDSSYYAMPSVASATNWAARTPEDFCFRVKAFRLFSRHQTALAVMHRDLQQALALQGQAVVYYRDVAGELRDELWHRFKQTLAPRQQAGKLAAVHFQFPPWVRCNPARTSAYVGVRYAHGRAPSGGGVPGMRVGSSPRGRDRRWTGFGR